MSAMHKKASLFQLFKTTITQWLEDRGPWLSAAFSYYGIFSIAPLLIIALTLAGVILGQKAASDQLRPQIAGFIGDKAAEFVQDLVTKLGSSTHLSLAGVISIVLIIYAATNLFIALQDSLNTLFGVQPKPGRGIKGILRDRLVSFLMVGVIGLFVLASIAFSTALAALTRSLPASHPALMALVFQIVNFLVSTVIFTGIFALMFKYLPDIKVDWRDTLIGALFTAVLFTLARIGLGYYLGRSSTASPFGAAGSLVVIMLFIYYSSQIFFLGAKFTKVFACRAGMPIQPSDNAVLSPCPVKPDAAKNTTTAEPCSDVTSRPSKAGSKDEKSKITFPRPRKIDRVYPTHPRQTRPLVITPPGPNPRG